MAMTPAQRQKAYRERKRAQLGDAYKTQEALKRKLRRQRQRLRQSEAKSETKSEVKEVKESKETKQRSELKELINVLSLQLKKTVIDIPLVEHIVKKKAIPVATKIESSDNCSSLLNKVFQAKKKNAEENGRTIKLKSVQQQMNKVKNLHKLMNDETTNCKDFGWLRDTKKVVAFIKNNFKAQNTIVSNIASIASILKALKGYEDEYRFYSKVSTKLRKEINNEASDNLLTEKEAKNAMKYDELKDLYKKKGLNAHDKLLIGLYTLLPPRRIEAFRNMKLVQSRNLNEMDDKHNYLVRRRNNPTKLVFQRFKTDKTYKKQENNIVSNLELTKLIRKYIQTYRIQDGDYLFSTRAGNPHINFTQILHKSFQRASGKDISVNLLRHAYISDFLSTTRSEKARKTLALQMGHSEKMQQKYVRMELLK